MFASCLILVTVLGILGFTRSPSAYAQSSHACELELILAVDVSGSINRDEYALQMRGLVRRFQVVRYHSSDQIDQQQGRCVHATVVQWSGQPHQGHKLFPGPSWT